MMSSSSTFAGFFGFGPREGGVLTTTSTLGITHRYRRSNVPSAKSFVPIEWTTLPPCPGTGHGGLVPSRVNLPRSLRIEPRVRVSSTRPS